MSLLRHSGHALLLSKRRIFIQTQTKLGAIFFCLVLIFPLASSFAQAAKRKKPHTTLEFIFSIDAGPDWQAKQDAFARTVSNYSALRAWQKTQDLLGELERRVDLNGDGVKERFVAYGGPAAYGWYAIFACRRGRWRNIGGANLQDDSKVRILRTRHHGWHNFEVDLEKSRGGMDRYLYSWDNEAGNYELKWKKEIRAPDNSGDLP
jgi:hypothetical protein